jgi:catechol 2,3-dioxygenase-like lactoylglutathione lyase family enzyme
VPLNPHLRIARPVRDLERSAAMYQAGLDLEEIGRFENHAGFDGVILGWREANYHFELTFCRTHPVAPAPTPEDLVVFYLPELKAWQEGCARMLQAGFSEVRSFNPYWAERGRTFADADGYRVVLEQAAWG